MKILGVTSPVSWNAAACLLVDGELVAAAEEERFINFKHAPRMAAKEAMQYCLAKGEIGIEDVDVIAVGHESPTRNFFEMLRGWLRGRLGFSRMEIEREFSYWADHVLRWRSFQGRYVSEKRKLHFVRHHLAHAASAYYFSSFRNANIITLDGRGGSESGLLAVGIGKEIRVLRSLLLQDSWGIVYEEITRKLGFRAHSDEGKVMGLSAYGRPSPLPFVDWKRQIPAIHPVAMRRFLADIPDRQPNDSLTKMHRDLAASLQYSLEKAALLMLNWLESRTGARDLCLAGGVAMNCSMNGLLYRSSGVSRIFIQPAAHDAGTAIGAAAEAWVSRTGTLPRRPMRHAYWGPEYSNDAILDAIRKAKIKGYERYDNICPIAAKLLAENKIIGWFQGGMELGARALGNRSILANPEEPAMKDRVNLAVKWREPWRPFAPSILIEYADRYLKGPCTAPFMIHAFESTRVAEEEITSALHVDRTCRPHLVEQETNPKYWHLIDEFRKLSGVPAVLNTSFNVKGQPIVNTPMQAIMTFYSCGLDYLVAGDYLIWK